MFGWFQTGLSNTAFSNVNSNDVVLRTEYDTDKIVMGSGKDSNRNASLYIQGDSVGVLTPPSASSVFDVAGVFAVTKDSNVSVIHTITAASASICNLTVSSIQYDNA